VLISGTQKPVDLEDLKAHTKYTGGYTSMDKHVQRFWKAASSMDAQERSLLLRFATSCERAPLLGFHTMHPPFCIHRVPIRADADKLPSASTCFNTLKLPTYSSTKVTKEKLLISIKSGAGFEMS